MNKEQIKKHGEVIKWFCDNADKGVWYKDGNEWFHIIEPSWVEEFEFIQNDKYAELRKAQADGKTIEYQYKSTTEKEIWFPFNMTELCSIFADDRIYQIKPDEPEFKIGDWVEYDASNPILLNKTNLLEYNNNEIELRLWKPQKGEWCVFWNNDMEDYVISKFTHNAIGGYACIGKHIKPYDNIAPLKFIQTLKDN